MLYFICANVLGRVWMNLAPTDGVFGTNICNELSSQLVANYGPAFVFFSSYKSVESNHFKHG